MGLLAYILTLPGNNDACGASTAWDIYLLPPSSLIFIPPPIYPFFLPLSLILYTSSSPYSFFLCMCVSISIIYPILIIVFICISSFYLCVSLPSTRSISLSPLFIPSSSSSSSFFYVCMYIFIFYLIFIFWTDLGNVCHYNKYMEKFLTIQSSIYLQTNSKTYFILLLLIFLCLYVYFYFLPYFYFLDRFGERLSL